MKLLITTQAVDIDDPILGFFHSWIIELSERFESVIVICLKEGRHELPANVKVLSLGKEKGESRSKYIRRFYSYIIRERNNYDAVFVHMNQEYMLLGGLLWKGMGKRIMFWRNHPQGNFRTRIALMFTDRLLCTSPRTYAARLAPNKLTLMPVGIDTDLFLRQPDIDRDYNAGLYLGRLSPVKKIEVIIKAMAGLKKDTKPASLTIVGGVASVDTAYAQKIRELIQELDLGASVAFKPSVSNREAVEYYNRYGYSVNATPTGSFDKTIFEAMACEQLVVVSNQALVGKIDPRLIFSEDDPVTLAARVKDLSSMDPGERRILERSLRDIVVGQHSLSSLADKVAALAQDEK